MSFGSKWIMKSRKTIE